MGPVTMFALGIGLVVGSFINAAVFRIRWPHEGSLVTERSHCPRCHTTLPWYDLIPLLSFFWLRRRCRFCHESISWQYPTVELATGALFAFAAFHQSLADNYSATGGSAFGGQLLITSYLQLLITWFSIATLIFLFVFDLRFGLLPDNVTIPATIIIIISRVLLSFTNNQLPFTVYRLLFTNVLLPVFVGAAFFALQYILSHGRWVGGGDIRMGALMGAIVGWPGILVSLGCSYVIGSVIALILIALGKKHFKGDTIPMGPFLAVGTLAVLFFGDRIMEVLLYPYLYL